MNTGKATGRKRSIYSIQVGGDSENDFENFKRRRQSSIVNEIRARIEGILHNDISRRDSDFDIETTVDPKYVNAIVAGNDAGDVTLKAFNERRKQSHGNLNAKSSLEDSHTRKCSGIFQRKWLVLVAAFVNLFISPGFPFNMAPLYVEFSREFGRSKAETSLVQSVCTGIILIGGLISGGLVSRYGTRICAMVGGLISSLGLLASFFATSVPFLVGTIGVLGGSGFSLNYLCASTSVGYYFHGKDRLLALAFIVFGSGIGSMVFPLLIQLLIEEYGWRGCMVIISGIAFHMCLCGAIWKQPDKKMNTHSFKSIENDNVAVFDKTTKGRTSISKTCLSKSKDMSTIVHEIKTCLRNKQYVTFTFGLATALGVFNSVTIFIVDYFEFVGFGRTVGVWIYFGMTASGTLFRILPGFLARNRTVPKVAIPATSIAIAAGALFLLNVTRSLTETVVAVCVFGIGLGGIVTTISITTLELVGFDNFSSGLGITLTAIGIFTISAAPLFGYIRDVTGSYDLTFNIGAGCAMFASCILIFTTIFCGSKGRELGSHDVDIVIERRRSSVRRNSFLPRRASVDLTVF